LIEISAVDKPIPTLAMSKNLNTLNPKTHSETEKTFSAFEDAAFCAYGIAEKLRSLLEKSGYTESMICSLLKRESLQQIKPTHLHYYDRFLLPSDKLGDLIRLFLLRVKLPETRIRDIFEDACFNALEQFGILTRHGGQWASRVQIFCTNDLYIATDHRYMIYPEDALQEDPVMYIGTDSTGLTHVAPRSACDKLLDLCTGSGVQALTASRYAHLVVGIDINPRAIRFARFNAQLNGIRNVCFLQGDLYNPVAGQKFDIILANPPYVPSPTTALKFRDGGVRGENILARIIGGAAYALRPKGKLHIVTDLVDVNTYEAKLEAWWRGGPAHKFVLKTADRNDSQYSVPHCHAPFDQSYQEYNEVLEHWVKNFHDAGIKTINFGYILIQCLAKTDHPSYFLRTISNPKKPIYQQVEAYFTQRNHLSDPAKDEFFLRIVDGVHIRSEYSVVKPDRSVEIFVPDNPYYTTYVVSENVLRELETIAHAETRWKSFVNENNQALIRDLIYKGILMLTKAERHQGHIPDRRKWSSRQHSNHNFVRELETETTPTCLSSYL
jgi:carbamoyltransferase